MTPPQPHEPGQGPRDGLPIHVARAVRHAHRLVHAGIGRVEVAELGQREAQPPARRDVGDGRLVGHGPLRLQRLHVLPKDELRAPVLTLHVPRETEVTAGERLQRQVLRRVGDAQAPLAVVDRQVWLAGQVVVVHEIAVYASQARLVA